MMKSPLKLSIFQQFHNRDQPENMLRCICLAPIRNAVNTRVSGPDKTGKEKKNTITLRKEPSMVIYALSDFLIMILSWLVKQSLRAFLFQEVQL